MALGDVSLVGAAASSNNTTTIAAANTTEMDVNAGQDTARKARPEKLDTFTEEWKTWPSQDLLSNKPDALLAVPVDLQAQLAPINVAFSSLGVWHMNDHTEIVT